MRVRLLTLLTLGGLGCRAVLGIEDPPEGPGSAASSGSASSSASTTIVGSGGDGSTGSGGTGPGPGAGGGGSTAETSTGAAGGGSGGGDGCPDCGDVNCCRSACEADVCMPTTFELEAVALRMARVGGNLAVMVDDGAQASLQWIPTDRPGPLPPRCLTAAGDPDGRGYVVGHGADAYYANHTGFNDPSPGSGGSIFRIELDCRTDYFALSTDYGGIRVRNDTEILAVSRDSTATSTVACIAFDDRICTGAMASVSIYEGFAVDIDPTVDPDGDGEGTVLWTATTSAGGDAVLLGDGPPKLLFTAMDPVDLEITEDGRRWILGVEPTKAELFETTSGVRCAFAADGALGFAQDGDVVFLPHADGLVVCDDAFASCRLAAAGPVHDVLLTDDALFYSAGSRVTQVARPLDAWLETLDAFSPCEGE